MTGEDSHLKPIVSPCTEFDLMQIVVPEWLPSAIAPLVLFFNADQNSLPAAISLESRPSWWEGVQTVRLRSSSCCRDRPDTADACPFSPQQRKWLVFTLSKLAGARGSVIASKPV